MRGEAQQADARLDRPAVIACEAVIRILCDVLPGIPTDAAYLFAQTPDNEPSVTGAATSLMMEAKTRRIMILDSPSSNGYAGAEKWEELLNACGIGRELIDRVPFNARHHNTLTEAEAMLRFAKERNYRSLTVTAPPFHQVRAFMTSVRLGCQFQLQLKLYSSPGVALDWMQRVVHSQGRLVTERRGLILEELKRIETYVRKGDLISFEEVIAYLNQRDLSDHEDRS
jgi:hypothetical protein